MLPAPKSWPIKNEIWPRLAVLAQSNRILNTDPEPALRLCDKKVQKDIADIGVPGSDRFHVGNDVIEQFRSPIQEPELAKLVILLDAEAVKVGMLVCAHLMPSFLNRSLSASSV